MPIIAVRDETGNLNAFFNSCRHRGAPLTEDQFGTTKSLVCPFHRWCYRLNGQLFRAPGIKEKVDDGLGKIGSNLVEIPCEVRENLVFICLDPEPEQSIEQFLGNFIENVAKPHGISSMRRIRHRRYEIDANWKLYAEVDMETLHVPHVHRKTIGDQHVEMPNISGNWHVVFNRSETTAALSPKHLEHALPPNPNAYGQGLEGTHFSLVMPGFFIVNAPDCMWWIQKTPISPTKTEIDIGYAFPESIIETTDFEEKIPYYIDRLNEVIREDNVIIQYQQKGLTGSFRGRYTEEEIVVHQLAKSLINVTTNNSYLET